MVDLDVYRKRIGSYNLSKGNFKGKYICVSSERSGNKCCMSSTVSMVNVSMCVLYFYYIILVAALSMSMSFYFPVHTKPVFFCSCLFHTNYRFYDLSVALANVKLFYAISIAVIFNKYLSSKSIKKFILYKLILKKNSKYAFSGRVNRLCQSLIFWLCTLNFLLITIINPNLLNPGPEKSNHSVQTRPLKILYNNVQGLINPRDLGSESPPLNMTKVHELQGHIFKHTPDIVVVNESWLKSPILSSEILPTHNYKIIRCDRSGKTHPYDPSQPKKFRKNGGGVFIAHRKDIGIESTEVGLVKVQAEILTVNFKLPTGKRFSLSTFYRVGTLGSENFELVKNYLTTLAIKKKLDKHLLIGDLNFPEIGWPDSSTTVELHKNFIELFMTELDHTQMIFEPTHKNGGTLDLLFTNVPNLLSNVTVLGRNEVCSSDHFGIIFNIKLDISIKKTVKRKVYDFSKADWKNLNFDLKRVNWDTYMSMQDPHISWPVFKEVLSKLCDVYIPKKSVRYQFQPPWFDSDCDKILSEKEKWRAKSQSDSGTEEDHEMYRSLRRKYKKIVNEKMRLNVVDESDTSLISKKFWKYVKSKSKSSRIPETVRYNNRFRTKPLDQANLFNEYFYDQFSDASLYEIDIDINAEDKFLDLEFHELDVLLLLKSVNSSKAAGPDGIHGMVLKNCAVSLAKPLTSLFNASFVTGCIPDEWKLASIVPVHKKDDKVSVENYRPISLTSLVMKVFEKCIRKELMHETEKFLDQRQHGFINGKSCTTQMVPFTYNLALGLNNKSKIDVIYFDFAKAFDSVSHDIILKKLKEEYGVNGTMLRFVKSYLQGRQQQVVVGGVKSGVLPVKSGVPQGSILGPLLFVLFINDMFNCISEGTNIALYADDTKIWREINYSKDHFILQGDIDNLNTWSISNKMKFHPSKSKALSVTNQRSILNHLPCTIFNYKLGPNFIDYVNSQVDLGVTITTKLLWNSHCDKLAKNASSKLALLMRSCHFTIDKKQKRAFYLTVVRSIFEHCSIIWHPLSPNQLSKFDAIQKKAVKWINGQQFDHYTELEYIEKLKKLCILPIKYKFAVTDLILFFKIMNCLVPIALPEQFTVVQSNNVRLTRQTAAIKEDNDITTVNCSIKPSCDSFRNCFFYRTMTLWNSIPYIIRQQPSITKFKSQVTQFLLSADLDWPD